MITIFIGANDLCNICGGSVSTYIYIVIFPDINNAMQIYKDSGIKMNQDIKQDFQVEVPYVLQLNTLFSWHKQEI